jgi:hypothetical protein
MPCYKILGIYSYADNLREITNNEPVILKHEKYNIKSKNAIGVYTKKNNKKIGYLPTENNNELLNFNNSYIISKLQLNQDYPIVEISRSYPNINILNNYELTFIKKIKYNYQVIDQPSNLKIPLTTLINTLKRKRINVKRLAITYLDDNYINIIIETSKGLESFYTITLKYFTENQDKYNELYDYNLIDNIFFKELLFHRPEKYFEINYINILDYNSDIQNNIQNEFIKIDTVNSINSLNDNIDILYFTKLYLYCIINQNYEYIIKYLNQFTTNKYDDIINQLHDASYYDLLFLGHHIRDKEKQKNELDRDKDIMPLITKRDTYWSFLNSLGGTGGYIISKNGAKKMLDFINKTGSTNGINTLIQKSANELNIYYCNPHMIFTDCYRGDNKDLDTDIQFDYSNDLVLSLDQRLSNELEFYD